jgi:hypothetical protein
MSIDYSVAVRAIWLQLDALSDEDFIVFVTGLLEELRIVAAVFSDIP